MQSSTRYVEIASPRSSSEDKPQAKISSPDVISIPLPEKFKTLTLSQGTEVFSSLLNIMVPLDRFFSSFGRFPGVVESVLTGAPSIGFLNRALVANQGAADAFYILLALYGLYVNHIDNVEKKRAENEIQNIYKKLLEKKAYLDSADSQSGEIIEEYRKQLLQDQQTYNINIYLKKLLDADEALKTKYQAIEIDFENNQFNFKRNKTAELGWIDSIYEYGFKPLRNSAGFASFVFWLMWIGAVATTGMQLEGIAGVSSWVSLGIPAGLGVINLGTYFYNAWKYGGFAKARQQAEAHADFQVLTKALLLREHERDIDYLNIRKVELAAELERRKMNINKPAEICEKVGVIGVQASNGLLDKPLLKGNLALLSRGASNWTSTTSLSWYTKVLIETVCVVTLATPFLGTAIGGVIFGIACAYGLHKGYHRYREAKAMQDQLKKDEQSGKYVLNLDSFEVYYKSRVACLEKLKAEMQAYKKAYSVIRTNHYVAMSPTFDVKEKNVEDVTPKTWWGRCKEKIYDVSIAIRHHPIIDAWDTELGGIFLGRMIFTAAASFLPFAPILLTGPIGLAAIGVVSTVYLGIKWYESYQQKKEKRIRELPNNLESLEKEIEKARLTVEDMKMSERLIRDDACLMQEKLLDKKAEEVISQPKFTKKLFDSAVFAENDVQTIKKLEPAVATAAAIGL